MKNKRLYVVAAIVALAGVAMIANPEDAMEIFRATITIVIGM